MTPIIDAFQCPLRCIWTACCGNECIDAKEHFQHCFPPAAEQDTVTTTKTAQTRTLCVLHGGISSPCQQGTYNARSSVRGCLFSAGNGRAAQPNHTGTQPPRYSAVPCTFHSIRLHACINQASHCLSWAMMNVHAQCRSECTCLASARWASASGQALGSRHQTGRRRWAAAQQRARGNRHVSTLAYWLASPCHAAVHPAPHNTCCCWLLGCCACHCAAARVSEIDPRLPYTCSTTTGSSARLTTHSSSSHSSHCSSSSGGARLCRQPAAATHCCCSRAARASSRLTTRDGGS